MGDRVETSFDDDNDIEKEGKASFFSKTGQTSGKEGFYLSLKYYNSLEKLCT